MKTNFTRLLLFTALFFTVLQASSQAVGDYRTNVTDGIVAQWTTVATWQRFDGSTWAAAAAIPTSADGVITIQTGDTIQLSGPTSNISIDQVLVQNGAAFVIFNNTGGAVTLNDGAGNDIDIDGRCYVAGAANLTGTGTIHVNAIGQFTLRNSGVLGAQVVNDGTMYLGAPSVSAGTISATTVTNNGTCTWIDGTGVLAAGASFVNNGTFNMATNGSPSSNWNVSGAAPSITNNGTIIRTSTNNVNILPPITNTSTGIINSGTGSFTFTNLTNAGTLSGNGTFTTPSGSPNVPNTGIISPGNSPGTLTLQNLYLNGSSASVNIELASDGAVQGVNYDHLIVPTSLDPTAATLNVTNNTTTADPVGTMYTIITSTVGVITGPFATVNKPTNFSITYNSNSIVLTKTALFPLPVTWGEFKALAQGSKVLLDWTTLMEENTSHFVIEHSTTGNTFTPVANVEARGNSTYEANYKYTFASPDLTKANYFRIKQVDLDGKSTYSVTRSVKFDKGQVVAIQAYPNPVKDVLTLNIQRENIQVLLADQTGKTIQRLNVQPGQHSINMQSLPTGIYQLAVFEKGVRIETKQIMKQ